MELVQGMSRTAFAFRGYNHANLGRTPELFAVPAYRAIMRPYLEEASQTCSEALGREVDLIERITAQRETTLDDYAESIAMIVAVEQAQMAILEHCHDVNYREAAFNFGFSLGEISALVTGGTFTMHDALQIPLRMAQDGIDLAKDVTLAILFCRREELKLSRVRQVLMEINNLGKGVIGISTHLGPNSVLVMGTGETIDLLRGRLKDIAKGVHLRRNEHRWPPLHTPIVWERDITTRAARMLHTLPGGFTAPQPPVLSLVTGYISYDEYNARNHLVRWVDQTQRLWEVLYHVLSSGTKTVVHVGPAPNIIPATIDRLASNVEAQTKKNRGMQALSAVADRPWLRNLLPKRAALLRAPKLQQIVLEDWLLENTPEKQLETVASLTVDA